MSLRELEMRAHVHDLLHDYALTHITTDYIAFTNTAVHEVGSYSCLCNLTSNNPCRSQILSQSLHAVPTRDSTSLALEPPLPELIASTLKLSKVSEYEEKLDVSPESKLYLKDFLHASVASGRTQSKSERCWTEGENGAYLRVQFTSTQLTYGRRHPSHSTYVTDLDPTSCPRNSAPWQHYSSYTGSWAYLIPTRRHDDN